MPTTCPFLPMINGKICQHLKFRFNRNVVFALEKEENFCSPTQPFASIFKEQLSVAKLKKQIRLLFLTRQHMTIISYRTRQVKANM